MERERTQKRIGIVKPAAALVVVAKGRRDLKKSLRTAITAGSYFEHGAREAFVQFRSLMKAALSFPRCSSLQALSLSLLHRL